MEPRATTGSFEADWPPELAEVRALVYRRFADTGAPPSPAEIATALGLDPAETLERLRALHRRHQIVLATGGDAIRMAHPFSAAPMGFVLRADDDRLWWGGCAWDSFGIVAALGEEVAVITHCAHCGADLAFRSGPATPPPAGLAVRVPRPASEWWDDVVATCTHIRLFCDEGHARAHVEARDLAPGAVVPAERMWRLAVAWYGNRLDPDFRPYTAAYKQQLLTRTGLTGAFWRL
jgi:hypothetical protein